jgi:hypothetical protein
MFLKEAAIGTLAKTKYLKFENLIIIEKHTTIYVTFQSANLNVCLN